MRTVDRLVAARAPACAALHEGRVITAADHELDAGSLLLKMALQAERLVACLEHLVVYGAVRVVARGAVLTQRFVLENKRTALSAVTLEAGLIRAGEFRAAGHYGVTFVRIVAVAARDFAGRVGMRQREFAALVEMALETGIRIAGGVDDVGVPTAFPGVDAARAVTRLAPDVFGIVARRHQLGVGGIVETGGDRLVALDAFLRSHEFRTGNVRRHYDGAVYHHTRDEQQPPGRYAAEDNGIFGQTGTRDHGRIGLKLLVRDVGLR